MAINLSMLRMLHVFAYLLMCHKAFYWVTSEDDALAMGRSVRKRNAIFDHHGRNSCISRLDWVVVSSAMSSPAGF